jgi:putative ABC transport system substrate-binding protein
MKRREFVSLLSSAAVWPFAARAQQPTLPVIGLLSGTGRNLRQLDDIRQGLNTSGYVEGRNVSIEYRFAEGQYDRLAPLAADLVSRQVKLILTIQAAAAALAAKAASATIPIVFSIGGDPVKFGLVTSMNHPGGNATGTTFLVNTLGAKRLEVLHELVPRAKSVGLLANPKNPASSVETSDIQEAARTLGLQVYLQNASNDDEVYAAFNNFVGEGIDGLTFAADAFLTSRSHRIIALATQHAIPTVYFLREFADAGGLISYGGHITEAYRLAGGYAGRILKGEKPADLPVQQVTRVELVINLKAAKALGISIPLSLLGRADEVID